jgi:hypothetical protein
VGPPQRPELWRRDGMEGEVPASVYVTSTWNSTNSCQLPAGAGLRCFTNLKCNLILAVNGVRLPGPPPC